MNAESAVEIWLTVSITCNILQGMVLVVGSIWSAFREIHIRDQSKELAKNLDDVATGYIKITQSTDLIVARIADMNQLTKDERRELIEWLREQKRDQVALLVDIERRLTHVMDRGHTGTGTSVNFNSGGQNNIGQTDIRGNQQQI